MRLFNAIVQLKRPSEGQVEMKFQLSNDTDLIFTNMKYIYFWDIYTKVMSHSSVRESDMDSGTESFWMIH